MMVRSGGRWRAARIAPFKKDDHITKLSDIVRVVEAEYGPGNFYCLVSALSVLIHRSMNNFPYF